MYLQKVEIQGFKSFGRKTVLEFPKQSFSNANARSIAAVVGPNGSGKSNVVDAIRWVLGEQSMKLLRGKKVEDIIFSGSSSRARLGAAEVSICLNNEDRFLENEPLEIVITRKIFRDGEGEYLINNKKVRLFDVLMLMAKANFGQKSFSIIGQGMVDHVINMSVFERKDFFDEATGVKQYQIKRDQADSRMKSAQNNLEKANGILSELEPRLRLLHRQMKRLERRAKVEQELRVLQRKYYGKLVGDIEKKKDELTSAIEIKASLASDLDGRLVETRQQMDKISRGESRKDIFNNLQKEFNRLIAEKNNLTQELAVLEGKMSVEYIKRGKENLAWLEKRRSDLDGRIGVVKDSLETLESKLTVEQSTVAEKNERLEKVKAELLVLENNLAAAKNQADLFRQGKNWEANYVVQAILRQKSYIKGIEGIVSELFSTKEDYQKAIFVAAKGVLNAVVVKDCDTAVRCINYLKQNRLGMALFIPLNRLKINERCAEDAEKLKANPLRQGYSVARGAISFLDELVDCDGRYKKLRDYLFGNILVFDTLENAQQVNLGKFKVVTLAGDMIDKRGFFYGGFLQKMQSFSLQKDSARDEEQKIKEIAMLGSRADELKKEIALLTDEANTKKINLEILKTKEKGLRNDLSELAKERARLSVEIDENKLAPEDQDVYLKNLNSRKKEIESQIAKIEKNILEKRTKIDRFNIEEEKKTREIFDLQKHLQVLQEKANKIGAEVSDLKVELGKIETREDALRLEVRQELGPADGGVNGEAGLEYSQENGINVDALWHEIGKLKHDLEMIGGIDEEMLSEYGKAKERYDFLNSQVSDLERAIADLDKVRRELDIIIQKQFTEAFQRINKEFNHYCEKIFQGAKAKLIFIEEQLENGDNTIDEEKNIQEQARVGIDIAVSLLNKKIANIAMLSGGEKTMVSIALICAIVASNPSPFVVFDEIDAALDEVNSERLAIIMRELSEKTQFILITHNRVIMHVADVLYGVTMTGEGISRVLSLSFTEAEKQAQND
ncbi:AAA family ATPase [Candidatus Falkowbacteria bacterium]|nr:AAA family ATPase [Candidatus Falkowbacteria bacterium]